jgi:hypothetical protein
MTKRHVVQPLMRHALSGEDVDVHPDHLDAFDKVNDPEQVSTPRTKAAPKTKPARNA